MKKNLFRMTDEDGDKIKIIQADEIIEVQVNKSACDLNLNQAMAMRDSLNIFIRNQLFKKELNK